MVCLWWNMKKRKMVCNYCGGKKHLHNYLGFVMCDECIQKVRGQKVNLRSYNE